MAEIFVSAKEEHFKLLKMSCISGKILRVLYSCFKKARNAL
jgi:hypothetical protein